MQSGSRTAAAAHRAQTLTADSDDEAHACCSEQCCSRPIIRSRDYVAPAPAFALRASARSPTAKRAVLSRKEAFLSGKPLEGFLPSPISVLLLQRKKWPSRGGNLLPHMYQNGHGGPVWQKQNTHSLESTQPDTARRPLLVNVTTRKRPIAPSRP